MLLLSLAVMATADDLVTTISSKLSLNLVNVQSLQGQGNSTCFTAGWKIAKDKGTSAQLDLLLLPNYMAAFKWGAGASIFIPGKVVNLKLGAGYISGWVGYLGLPLVGGVDANMMDKPHVDLNLLSTGGAQVVYRMRL